jgi:hypothetical protein
MGEQVQQTQLALALARSPELALTSPQDEPPTPPLRLLLPTPVTLTPMPCQTTRLRPRCLHSQQPLVSRLSQHSARSQTPHAYPLKEKKTQRFHWPADLPRGQMGTCQ